MTTIRSRRTQQDTYDRIKGYIVSNRIRAGEIISESRLSGELSVGRQIVREALNRLELEGLVFTANKRKRVYILTIKDVGEIFDLKIAIEGKVARWAAKRGSPADKTRLVEISETFFKLLEERPSEGSELDRWNQVWQDTDFKFHELLCHMANNSRALQFIEMLNMPWYKLHVGIVSIESRLGKSAAEHNSIAEAVKNGHPEEAEAAMTIHLENTMVNLKNIMLAFHFPEK